MKKLLGLLTLVLVAVTLVACGEKNEAPTISGVGNATTFLFVEFDPLEGVTATDKEDGPLTDKIKIVSNTVNIEAVGNYQVKYEVEDSKGKKTEATRQVAVVEPSAEDVPLAQYLNGIDLSKLPAESKDVLFAAAERYLLENVYGGVPLYTGAASVMFSDRTQLFSPTFNGVLGFGTAFSQFSQDDSQVAMNASQNGNAGEYTWRASYSTDPVTLNQWIADDSATSDFIDLFTGSLYGFFFDETKTGYEILPSLAKSEPIPVNPVEINGKLYAKTWQIEVRDDLVWKYHPSTNVTGLPAGHEVLNAEDWLWTWRHALTEGWFRARTGGGDFVTNGVKGAADFLSGTIPIEQVGLRMAEGKSNTLEIEFNSDKSAFDIKYQFSSTALSPVHQQLMSALGANYGTSPVTVPSSGVYYFDVWNSGQLLLFKKNTLHPESSMYNYTGQQFRFISGSEQIFAEFLAGRLESAAVPSSRIVEFQNDPRVRVSPQATTWRLQINAFGTVENRDAYIAANPGVGLSETFVPEPILMYKEMRQALYYGFDRYEAAVNVVKTYLPAFTLFASTYFLDAESGTSVRGLPAGAAIVTDFGGDSYGFVPDAAVALFKQAVAKGIADGYYEKGTASAYTVIDLSFTYGSSGSTAAQAMVAEMKQQYESRLVDNENFVRITITVADVAFPTQYYNYMMKANTDLGLGGISGSLLNAPSFLDVFSDDNRGSFTLNWGIDTTTANIVVGYVNLDGDFVYEKWGFNALVMALNGETFVRDGVELGFSIWSSPEELITALVESQGGEVATIEDGSGVAEFDLGGSLQDKADDLGADSLVAKLVTTKEGQQILFLVSETNGSYKLFQQYNVNVGLSSQALIETYEGAGTTTDLASVTTYYADGKTLAEKAAEVFAESMIAADVRNADGSGVVVYIAKVGDFYVVYKELAYSATAFKAIEKALGANYPLIAATGPLTDAELAEHVIVGGTPLATIAAIAADLKIPVAYAEFYAVDINDGSGGVWNEGYGVLNFGGRYVGLKWYY